MNEDESSSDTELEDESPKKSLSTETTEKTQSAVPSLAAQMMASLTTLKTKSKAQVEKAQQQESESAAERKRQEELEQAKQSAARKRYVPTDPIEIKTTQSYEVNKAIYPPQPVRSSKDSTNDNKHRMTMVREIQRPPEIVAARYELPVTGMEFEIMDAIRNHDVTILCAETGSGKSTQVVQFLYEAGLSGSSSSDASSSPLMIGVTQPRRVAAVSTAKRVCYEMGQGNGQTILPNNLVAYQTRYETAGLGSQTHIKFMTDGILLQEIQHDLLLRRYSCIILDEAHERNLNTDVLIGLISGALQLRREAAAELPPLRVVIMSATLRVEDFTGNARLFSGAAAATNNMPAVVRVPGRAHPVTVHHSKVTELDDYGAWNAWGRKTKTSRLGGVVVVQW